MNERTAKLLNATARRFNLNARLLRKDWVRLSAKRKTALRRKFEAARAADRLELGGRTLKATR